MQRIDDFGQRRAHLANLDAEQLKAHFWQLTDQVVRPLIELSQKYTSPSVERSVLLRMGFSSLEAKEIVNGCIDNGLLGKGAGHVVWRLAKLQDITYREAGLQLTKGDGWLALRKYWE